MSEHIREFDVVALVRDHPERSLLAGQVGTVVECLDQDAFEVEFTDDHGRTYAMAAFNAEELMVLHYLPAAVA